MASNEHKTAAELEAEIEMQRNRVSDTIDEIQDRLSPGQIVDQLMSYTKGGAGDFAQNMGKSMMSNPLPVALLGVSLAWLMTGKSPMDLAGAGRSHRSRSSGSYYPPQYDGATDVSDYDDDYVSEGGSGTRLGWRRQGQALRGWRRRVRRRRYAFRRRRPPVGCSFPR